MAGQNRPPPDGGDGFDVLFGADFNDADLNAMDLGVLDMDPGMPSDGGGVQGQVCVVVRVLWIYLVAYICEVLL